MSTQLTICIVIFILTLISFILNKIPMWATAMTSLAVLVLTGCLSSEAALSGFSNSNTVLMGAMFIVAAGLRKTTFVDTLCNTIIHFTNGSFQKAYLGYIIIAVLLTNFISSPMVVFAIVAPLLATLCEKTGNSVSKVMFPLVVVCIGCCSALPLEGAITSAGQYNGFLTSFGVTDYVVRPIDYFFTKGPMLIVIPLWAYFIAPKFLPDQPVAPVVGSNNSGKAKVALSRFCDTAGIVIFFGTVLALVFSQQLGVQSWLIALMGSLLMVLTGVLNTKESLGSLPLDMILLFVGALGLGSALSATGAGDVIGNWLATLVGGTTNSYVLGALFFTIPFIITQFMLNRAVSQIFIPICILTCKSLGANPIGPMMLVGAGALTAFMTPMATPAIPMCMAEGGYDLKAIFKGGWFITIIISLVYIFYVMTIYPAF